MPTEIGITTGGKFLPVGPTQPLPVSSGFSAGSAQAAAAAITTTQIAATGTSAQVLAALANRTLMQWCFRENGGLGASIVLHNGTTNNNPVTLITLAPNESTEYEYQRGKVIAGGLYLEVISGNVTGLVGWV